MSIQKLRKELNELLENIVQHSQHFSEEKPIPPLEISVVLSKVAKMQENLVVLRFLLEQNEKMKKTGNNNINKTNIIEENSATIEANQRKNDTLYTEVKTETLTLTQSKPKTEEVAHKLNKQRLTNLKNAFSLNDRYLFANELFNKNMEAFNDAINKLENSINIEEAKQTINAFQTALNWENDNAYFIELVDMVEQRFS